MTESGVGILKYFQPDWMGLSDQPIHMPLLPSGKSIDFGKVFPDNDTAFTYPCLYSAIARSCKNKSEYHFVELGTFKGKSALYMSKEIEQHMKTTDTKIIFDTVDTFEGSSEHQEYLKEEKISLYDIAQTQLESMSDYVNIIVRDSSERASTYKDGSLDFVFIDADHSYAGVVKDISAYWKKLRIGGVMAGHDYDCGWFGVKNAVDDFFGKNELNLGIADGNWTYKDDNSGRRSPDPREKHSQKYWNVGEHCWGLIKTDTNCVKPLITDKFADFIRNASPQSMLGHNFALTDEELKSL